MKNLKYRLNLVTALLFAILLGCVFSFAIESHQLFQPFIAKIIGGSVSALSFGVSLFDFTPYGAMFMSYVKVNVLKPGDNKGKGGDKKDTITIFDIDDVLSWPQRDAKGIIITDNIVMKDGSYMVKIYGTAETIKLLSDSEGETDAKGILQTLELSHPGSSVEIREFRSYWMNRNIGCIVEKFSDGKKDLGGEPAAPLQMVFKAEDSKDKNSTVFTFKSTNKGNDIADYQGTMTYDTVTGTIAANATSIDLVNGEGRYQTTSGTAAAATITTCSNAADGMLFTLIGSGGTYPTTITKANDFVLKNGVSWSGLAGAEITFRAYKSDTAAWKFFEQSRK
jgi:hypothetical protein